MYFTRTYRDAHTHRGSLPISLSFSLQSFCVHMIAAYVNVEIGCINICEGSPVFGGTCPRRGCSRRDSYRNCDLPRSSRVVC